MKKEEDKKRGDLGFDLNVYNPTLKIIYVNSLLSTAHWCA
jgi:hypothetical protein